VTSARFPDMRAIVDRLLRTIEDQRFERLVLGAIVLNATSFFVADRARRR
jgi:hypothetical protein